MKITFLPILGLVGAGLVLCGLVDELMHGCRVMTYWERSSDWVGTCCQVSFVKIDILGMGLYFYWVMDIKIIIIIFFYVLFLEFMLFV